MKFMKYLSIIGLVGFGFAANVKAELSDAEYTRLRERFSEARIAIMSDEEKERFASADLNVQEKLFSFTESINGTITYTEVDPDIYDELDFDPENNVATYSSPSYHETSYKRIQIIDDYISGNLHRVMVYTQWLVTPATKSFDVTAMRVEDATIDEGSQDGTQTYWDDGAYHHISYSPNGTNIRKASNGFGISMNLVNSAAYFETDISADIRTSSSDAIAYGTYQHAVTDVTLSESQSYTISHNGLGGVLNFATGVNGYYDRMAGVYVQLLPY